MVVTAVPCRSSYEPSAVLETGPLTSVGDGTFLPLGIEETVVVVVELGGTIIHFREFPKIWDPDIVP